MTQLLPHETLLYTTHKHPIIFVTPLLCSVIILGIYYLSLQAGITHNTLLPPVLNKNLIFPGLLIIYCWMDTWLTYTHCNYQVSSHRVIMQEGFLRIINNELNLSTISEISIEQSIMGRLCKFGTVYLKCSGGNNIALPLIPEPQLMKQHIVQQLLNNNKQ